MQRAFEIANTAHAGQTRRSGEPYIIHPLTVAGILHDLNLDHESLAATLLHDVVEDTSVDVARLEVEMGPTVAVPVACQSIAG